MQFKKNYELEEKNMAYDGFNGQEPGAVRWEVYYVGGTCYVYALSEASARERFKAKYPNREITKVERKNN